MKRFAGILFFLITGIFITLESGGISRTEAFSHLPAGVCWLSSGTADLVSTADRSEHLQRSVQFCTQVGHKYSKNAFAELYNASLNSKPKVRCYISYSVNQIRRFEDADIVYPFHYFW